MPEFKKGQLVAVKIPGATKWELRVFERVALTDEPFCVEMIVRRPENATGYCVCMESVCPAEEVWPEIFIGLDRDAADQAVQALDQAMYALEMESALVQRLRKQIRWLCRQIQSLADIEWGNVCPPVGRSPYYINCQCNCIACWEQASLKAVDDAKEE